MKRALALVLILVMFFTFSGFGSKISNTPAEAPAADTANSIPEGFETSSYIYESSYGDTTFFLVIKNNTDSAVSISGNALAKDANGGSIGAGNFSVDVLGPGEETITYSYFNNVSGVDSVSFQMVTKTEPRYTPVLGGLDVKRFDNEQNVSLSVTNNGSVGAQFVEAYALFMDADNNVVRYASTYLTDVDIDDPIYQNTRKFVWSEDNPYFFKGKAGEGIGGPHCGLDKPWPMSLVMKAFTTNDRAEKEWCVQQILKTDGGTGFMHESFNKDDASDFTRSWFAWANTLFGELIVDMYAE